MGGGAEWGCVWQPRVTKRRAERGNAGIGAAYGQKARAEIECITEDLLDICVRGSMGAKTEGGNGPRPRQVARAGGGPSYHADPTSKTRATRTSSARTPIGTLRCGGCARCDCHDGEEPRAAEGALDLRRHGLSREGEGLLEVLHGGARGALAKITQPRHQHDLPLRRIAENEHFHIVRIV